ncbi:hypothetical protein CP980_19925 [Streptomyces vinaceus]|uniref:Uncharacterized protein n=1 Tax=Streptomyces vinaceus TaxID=1960 RepID=A0A5J6J7H3_STRVI|nr:hypothetical protein [Streptomyces vinaceus]QEV47057.1 hypothetical protein CP980_19925 [Streptomyces vinaceus]GHE55250.1 hypothetical protein GCM10017778_44400 [Streptomyces vinaceus]
MSSENPTGARQWPGYRSKPSHDPGQSLVFPGPVPAELRALGQEVRAADWPVRLAFRASRMALLDALCRWQTLRALAYVHALAAGTADARLLEDLRVVPGAETAADPALSEVPGRLERYALALPPDLVDAVVREAGGLLADNRFTASVLAAGLSADSRPADTDEAVSRAVVLTSYWYETPEQRGALALAWSANLFVRSWLWWSASFTYGDPAGGIGITADPRPARPAAAALPAWAVALLERASG